MIVYRIIYIILKKKTKNQIKKKKQIPKRTTENCPGFRKRIFVYISTRATVINTWCQKQYITNKEIIIIQKKNVCIYKY